MTAPFLCQKCGMIYPATALGADVADDSDVKCQVCGGKVERRVSAADPFPSRRSEGWLWLVAFPWDIILLVVVVAGAVAAWIKGS